MREDTALETAQGTQHGQEGCRQGLPFGRPLKESESLPLRPEVDSRGAGQAARRDRVGAEAGERDGCLRHCSLHQYRKWAWHSCQGQQLPGSTRVQLWSAWRGESSSTSLGRSWGGQGAEGGVSSGICSLDP